MKAEQCLTRPTRGATSCTQSQGPFTTTELTLSLLLLSICAQSAVLDSRSGSAFRRSLAEARSDLPFARFRHLSSQSNPVHYAGELGRLLLPVITAQLTVASLFFLRSSSSLSALSRLAARCLVALVDSSGHLLTTVASTGIGLLLRINAELQARARPTLLHALGLPFDECRSALMLHWIHLYSLTLAKRTLSRIDLRAGRSTFKRNCC